MFVYFVRFSALDEMGFVGTGQGEIKMSEQISSIEDINEVCELIHN